MAEQGGLEGSQPVDLSKHPSGIVPILQNIVSTVNLDCRLDLKQIALQARNAEYNPKRFAAVIMRIREPKTTALIFASGKMICYFTNGFEECCLKWNSMTYHENVWDVSPFKSILNLSTSNKGPLLNILGPSTSILDPSISFDDIGPPHTYIDIATRSRVGRVGVMLHTRPQVFQAFL